MFSHPPAYINAQFKRFLVTYAVSFMPSSSILSIIEDKSQFSSKHALLLIRPTTSQLKFVMKTVVKTTTAINNEDQDRRVINRLVIHHTHEKRFDSYKRDVHQIY